MCRSHSRDKLRASLPTRTMIWGARSVKQIPTRNGTPGDSQARIRSCSGGPLYWPRARAQSTRRSRPSVNQRELFDVVVRTIGLLVLLRGLWWLHFSALAALPYPGPPEDATWVTYIRPGAIYSIAGGLLMAYAEGIARLFYR
jgi:hypothetical protein